MQIAFKISLPLLLTILVLLGCSNDPQKTLNQSNEKTGKNLDLIEIQNFDDTPDFGSFTDVKEKKKAFFDYLYHYIEKVNIEVLERRSRLEAIAAKSADQITDNDREFLEEMAEMYLRDHDASDVAATTEILENHIKVIPPSLALAQAANESAWGTSRFATKANNYFGQWCFKKGCGLVPSERDKGTSHEVRKFKSPEGSVRSYVRNINTHFAYEDLRALRVDIANNGHHPSGAELAEGLSRYSERGDEYVEEIRSMIRINKLDKYDEYFWETVNGNNK